VGLWIYIQLAAGDGPIPVITGCSLRCYTGTVYTIAASSLYSPLALESLLGSLLDRAAFETAALREKYSFPREAIGRWKTLSLWKLWLIEGSNSVDALANRRLSVY
jgi:hypothetical protein